MFCPWLTKRPTIMTETNRIAFVMNMDKTNFQFTQFKFKVHNAVKIIAGNANVPTNVPNPLASFVGHAPSHTDIISGYPLDHVDNHLFTIITTYFLKAYHIGNIYSLSLSWMMVVPSV